MKKLLLTLVFSVFYVSSSSAEMGLNVGVSGQAGIFTASATEFTGSTAKGNGSEHGEAAWGSVFVEGTINDKFLIGVDYVPTALETETAETAKSNLGSGGAKNVTQTTTTNKIQIDFEDLTTVYVGFMVNENVYIKGGAVHVEFITNEDLGTGASYGNDSLDGEMFGVGYHNTLDNGAFIRFEGTYMSFNAKTMSATGTDADNKIDLSALDGITGKVSFGKSF